MIVTILAILSHPLKLQRQNNKMQPETVVQCKHDIIVIN